MIKEAYCSFEVSKLLKEKGFNERSSASYDSKGQLQEGYGYWNKTPIWYAAPTHQFAMSWLREQHKIFIEIGVSIDLNGNYHFSYRILDKECKYVIKVCTDFDWTYEDAVEAAIKYSLENLI